MTAANLTADLKRKAETLGFELGGVSAAVAPTGLDRLDQWLAADYAGQMHYIADRRDAYAHPQYVLDGVKTILMLSMHYRTVEPAAVAEGEGRVSRYAWGSDDYHNVIRDRLHQLADYLRKLVPSALTRGVVDTAPLLEREFAQLAGLGWVGKNTMLISPETGSYFFLAALLTDVELEIDTPHVTDHCGTCTACLDACPTDAFPQPYVLDATRCISYLTIELQDVIQEDLRSGMGNWLFGCDVCQDVCPWNRHAPQSKLTEFVPQESNNPLDLASLFEMDEAAFRKRFRHTPLWRSHRRGLLRNAAIVLGNQRAKGCITALGQGLQDSEPLVRGACAWALGQMPPRNTSELLRDAQVIEQDPQVLAEIAAALAKQNGRS